MVVTIARQLCLQATTVGNFFMNSRRRSSDKWQEESHDDDDQMGDEEDDDTADEESPMDAVQQHNTKQVAMKWLNLRSALKLWSFSANPIPSSTTSCSAGRPVSRAAAES